MKKLTSLLLMLVTTGAFAQDSLKIFNQNRVSIQKTGMEVLGSWAIANLAVGSIASSNTSGSTKYFYQMDALWNIANLGAAVAGYIGTKKESNLTLLPADILKQQRKIETIFLVNVVLDLAYIGGGIYLHNRGDNENSDKLRGYGSGIILQGAFLFLFDNTMYFSEKSNGKNLHNFLRKNPVMFDGKRIGMLIHF